MPRIEIPVLQETETKTRFHATLIGQTPLLMHKPNLQVADGGPKKTNEKKIPTPTEEAKAGAYQFEDGVLYLPSIWIQRNMIEAGKAFQNPDNKKQTLMRVIASALVPPATPGFPLLSVETGEPITEYEIDTRRAVVQRAAIMRSRPMVKEWTAHVEIGVDTDAFFPGDPTDAQLADVGGLLLSVMRHGGIKLGIGDYRPEKSGPFGKYVVTDFAIERDED